MEIRRVVRAGAKVLATPFIVDGPERFDGNNYFFNLVNIEGIIKSANFSYEMLGKPHANPHKGFLLQPME